MRNKTYLCLDKQEMKGMKRLFLILATVIAEKGAIETIMNRKSVRSFTGEKLTEDQLTTLLKAAMAAPTAGNSQPWQFLVVTDDAKSGIPGADRGDAIKTAGAVIIVCGETTQSRTPRNNPDAAPEIVPNGFWYEDCSAAAENLLLAAEALDLGAVWLSCYPNEGKCAAVKAAFGLPENVEPLAIIPVGVPAGDDPPKDKWKPEKVHNNRW